MVLPRRRLATLPTAGHEQNQAPTSPTDETAYGDRGKLAVIKSELDFESSFPTGVADVPDMPTPMEAVFIALALLSPDNNIDHSTWTNTVLQVDGEYREQGALWKAPSDGDWRRPSGYIHRTVVCGIATRALDYMTYGTALQRWAGCAHPPAIGTLSKWFGMLGALQLKRPKKNAARAPFIYVMAARHLRHRQDELRAALNMEPLRQTRAVAQEAALVETIDKKEVDAQMRDAKRREKVRCGPHRSCAAPAPLPRRSRAAPHAVLASRLLTTSACVVSEREGGEERVQGGVRGKSAPGGGARGAGGEADEQAQRRHGEGWLARR